MQALKKRGIKGAKNASKLDEQVWNEFYNDLEESAFQSEKIFAELEGTSVERYLDDLDLTKEGLEKEQVVKVRVNQNFFRKSVLASYNYTCCITGLKQPELLIAGHIIPWSMDKTNRLNPRNGLAMNGLHDKAFECGLITITPDYKVKISNTLTKQLKKGEAVEEYFLKYDGKEILLPSKFLPDPEFLKKHNNERFKA
ncbi:MAG: HNH endonuclease [Candidatus Cyclobacteriaceae bacterium M2_1C_046]